LGEKQRRHEMKTRAPAKLTTSAVLKRSIETEPSTISDIGRTA